ncbi:MAG: NAD(P)-dependent oxidoreductase [Flavonifractor plautii]
MEERDEIFTKSDYVSLHVPATPETVHSISDREFDLMKETAYLINAARGSIVDEPRP